MNGQTNKLQMHWWTRWRLWDS